MTELRHLHIQELLYCVWGISNNGPTVGKNMTVGTVDVRREVWFSMNILICGNSCSLSLEDTQMMPVFLCKGFAYVGITHPCWIPKPETCLTKPNLPAIGNWDIRVKELQETNYLWVAATKLKSLRLMMCNTAKCLSEINVLSSKCRLCNVTDYIPLRVRAPSLDRVWCSTQSNDVMDWS